MAEIDIAYRDLITRIIQTGTPSDDRTGVGTYSLFGEMLVTNLQGNTLPAISLRKVAPRIAFEELMFMLNGKTQTKELEEKKIKIWQGNTTREFLDNRGLNYLEEGDFGRMYGVQLREFNGIPYYDYDVKSGDFCSTQFDQLQYMVDEIKNNPTSRRIIATHYNPAEADQGALFPCHIMTQFNVRDGKLDCLFWMRSSDVGYGLPYNLMYYGMFTHLVAELCGLEAGELVYQAGDSHLYKDQVESGMIEYMTNFDAIKEVSLKSPRFIVNKTINTLEDMLSLTWEDVEIVGYNPRPDFKNKPSMAV
jgi:thymidylate synthase